MSDDYSRNIGLALAELGELGQQDISIAPLCTYKVGGSADIYVEANSVADLEAVSQVVNKYNLEVLLIGKGSNLLLSDSGFRGLVLHLGNGFTNITIDEENAIVVSDAIVFMPIVARKSAAAALSGFEWAVGVPGSIGGGVRMNAGGHGSDISSSLTSAEVFDLDSGSLETWDLQRLGLRYRNSNLKSNQLVVRATFQLEKGDRETSEALISEIVQWRRQNQPGGQNAGSVFANPEGHTAAQLIDSSGLKGYRIGSASVSEKHANFIQADAQGKADDVYSLICYIQSYVESETGIVLHPENKLIGF